MEAKLRNELCVSADQAFFSLMAQVTNMLEAIRLYKLSRPDDTLSLAHKHEDLNLCVMALGSLPRLLADELKARSHNEPRLLSRLGVELNILNEFEIHLCAALTFFASERFDIAPYNHQTAIEATRLLRAINRRLD